MRFPQSARMVLVAAALLLPWAGTAQDTAPAPAAPPAGSVGGPGDVNLFPKRLVLTGRGGIGTIGLFNRTSNEGDYEIALIDMAMTPEGQLLSFENELDETIRASVRTASGLIRYSPRRVTLRGSEAQTIRLMARPPADLPPGEYRTHFTVTSVPRDVDQGLSIDDALGGVGEGQIGVTIRPRFGIAIPVILRVGDTTLETGITDAQLLTAQDGSQAVAFTITRSGTRSAFGDITVTSGGSEIAVSRGVGVYPEVASRSVIVPVTPGLDPALTAPGRRLTIRYVDDDYAPGAQLAAHEFVVR